MNVTRLIVLTLLVLSSTGRARASSPAEAKRACVAASTEGQIARDEGRLLDAREQLLMCARDECPNVVKKSCGEWLADVEERIPSVVVRVVDAQGSDLTDATLTIDGEEVALDGRPVTLNPGQHDVQVRLPSGETSERKVLLAEKEKSRLINITGTAPVAELPPEDAAEPSEERPAFKVPTGAWVLGGVGILGLASFTYFGLSAKSELDDLEQPKPDGCSPDCTDDDTVAGRRSALIADISLGVGAASLVGAVTWTLVAWKRNKSASEKSVAFVPNGTGGSVTLSGRF
jgi:hypothetical protein